MAKYKALRKCLKGLLEYRFTHIEKNDGRWVMSGHSRNSEIVPKAIADDLDNLFEERDYTIDNCMIDITRVIWLAKSPE